MATRYLGWGVMSGGLLTVLLVACSGGGGGSPNNNSTSSSGNPSGSGTGTAASSFVAQYCDLFGQCCTKAQKTYDQGKCAAFLSAFTSDATFDAAKGETCLAAVRSKQNDPSFCDNGSGDGACEGVFEQTGSGSKQPGELCDDSDDCAPSSEGPTRCVSSFANQATTRTCQIQARGKEGEDGCVGYKDGNTTVTSGSSSSSSDAGAGPPTRVVVCWTADGLFCDRTTKKCTRSAPVGGDCQTNAEFSCEKSAFCDPSSRKCVARLNAGQTCSQLNAKQCADKHFCDDATKTCTPSTPTGSPCEKNEQCENRQCTNGKCAASFGGSFTTSILCQ